MIHPASVAMTQGVDNEQFDRLLYALRQAGFVLMRTEELPPGWNDRYTPPAMP